MKPIIYKTYPRLFFLSTTFLGAIFFGLLSWFSWTISRINRAPIIYVILAIFILGSICSLYYFITIKVIKLSTDSIKVSYFILPFQKTFLLSEVKSISQSQLINNSKQNKIGLIMSNNGMDVELIGVVFFERGS